MIQKHSGWKATTTVGRSALIAIVAGMAALAGCVTTTPYDSAENPPPFVRTPLILHELRNAYADARAWGDPKSRAEAFQASLAYFSSDAYVPPNTPTPVRCPYSMTAAPRINDGDYYGLLIPLPLNRAKMQVQCSDGTAHEINFYSFQHEGIRFAKAWYVLANTTASDPMEEARFAALAEQYRAAATKPALPESMRAHKIAAELAVREKRLGDAATAYERALVAFPEWPQGHYNAALIYGELLALEPAIMQMQRYLLLVPDATNARQAQDKIYEWKSKLASR